METPPPKEYYSELSWALAHHVTNNHDDFFIRKPDFLELVLVLVYLLDMLSAILIVPLINLIPGLVAFVGVQSF